MKWCCRELTRCAYYFCLCTKEKDFYAELKRLAVEPHRWPKFIFGNGHATTHTLEHVDGKMIAIVCINPEPDKYTGIQTAALLVHEAVHIWQKHAAFIGSDNDHGDEEEAYAIQSIAQELMESFVEQTK